MPFGLKSIDATYQWLIDIVIAHHIKRNLEVYVDEMIIKPADGHKHANDLKDIM